MAKFRFNDESRKRLRANMEAYSQKKKKQLAVALEFWGDDTVGDIREEIHRVGAFDQGLLEAATQRTNAMIESFRIRLRVFNNAEHATVIAFGRKPGKHPPLLPLVGWAHRKGLIKSVPVNITFGGQWSKYWAASAAIFKRMKNRRGGAKKSSKPLIAEIRDLLIVRSIANKIFEKGYAGRHPFSRTIDRKARTFAKDVAALVRLQK